jgi:ParB-like chromosome segregation protein Spo0J
VADLDNIYLKLEKLLAGQQQTLVRITKQDEMIRVLAAGISVQRETIGTLTETINRLSAAMSKEGDGDLVKDIASMAASLKQIQQDGARMVVLVGRMPNAVAQAAQDAVLMAMGEALTPPPGDRG